MHKLVTNKIPADKIPIHNTILFFYNFIFRSKNSFAYELDVSFDITIQFDYNQYKTSLYHI